MMLSCLASVAKSVASKAVKLSSMLVRIRLPDVCRADVLAPVGREIVPKMSFISHVPDWLTAKGPDTVTVPDTGTGVARNCVSVSGPVTLSGAVSLVSMLDNDAFAVVCRADVAAPVGSADAVMVTSPVSTAVIFESMLETVASDARLEMVVLKFVDMDDKNPLPVVWRADVDAPVGRGRIEAAMSTGLALS
jgi:hypothetical protein